MACGKLYSVVLIALGCTLLCSPLISGLPTGAPICNATFLGFSAVRATHLSNTTRNITSGSIAAGGFAVSIDGVALNASFGAIPRTLDANRNYNVVIGSASGREFRGMHVLLAVNGSNVEDALLPQAPYVKSRFCNATGIGSLSHVEPSLKVNATGVLRVNAAYPAMTLDVNIVVSNTNVTGSIYYFTQYLLASVVVPTKSPTKTPTKAPVKAPVVAPIAAPAAPVAAPTGSKKCGLFGLRIFCPIKRCGVLGRLLGLCKN